MKLATFTKMMKEVEPNALRGFNAEEVISLIPRMWKWSWGFHAPRIVKTSDAIDTKVGLNTKVVMFSVKGFNHRGFVMICLNGSDLFNIYYFSNRGNLKKKNEDVYISDFAHTLDLEIEQKEMAS